MKLTKSLASLAVAGCGLTLALAGTATPASAATGTYGYNGNGAIAVGGGSDTTYKVMLALGDIYNQTSIAGCTTQTNATGPNQNPALNQCTSAAAPTSANANNDRDTIAEASPTGSSAGIASLNGDAVVNGSDTPGTYPYAGTSSGSVDFARSSRAPKTSGGNCAGGNELSCDTFWGFAEDGVEVFGFGSHGGINLTPQQVYQIYSCQLTTWSQVTGNSSDTAPIVPWGMNQASGTYSTFNGFLTGPAGAPSGFTADTDLAPANPYTPGNGKCVRQLDSTGQPPFENDVKPLFNDVQAHGGIGTGVNDPNNWIWFGSFGLLASFPYDNSYSYTPSGASAPTSYTGNPDSINGTFPSTTSVFNKSYPIIRTLYHVTLKTAADCPTNGTSCDFTNNPGPTITETDGSTTTSDLNVQGASSGPAKAVREFTRFLCRSSAAQDPVDPYSGLNLFSEVASARGASGFTAVPTTLRTAGTACQVQH